MNLSIVRIMDKDHKKIKELLEIFEINSNNDMKKADESFNRFKWNLEKHFFIEERVIFNHEKLGSYNEDISNILKEHEEILNLMRMIEDELSEEKKPKIELLKHLLLNHARFEDEIFYPKLDELLEERQKQEIIDRAKDIVI